MLSYISPSNIREPTPLKVALGTRWGLWSGFEWIEFGCIVFLLVVATAADSVAVFKAANLPQVGFALFVLRICRLNRAFVSDILAREYCSSQCLLSAALVSNFQQNLFTSSIEWTALVVQRLKTDLPISPARMCEWLLLALPSVQVLATCRSCVLSPSYLTYNIIISSPSPKGR